MTSSKINNIGIMENHPCFSEKAHYKFGRMHLPVAPACNIQCRYCVRKYDCANESRPGVTSRVLAPHEALQRVRKIAERDNHITVIGIAGPGDPLANDATFKTLELIHRELPDIILCLSTNGLLLQDRLDEIVSSGVSSLTITINAVSTETAKKIYSHVNYKGTRYEGKEGASLLIENQWAGLKSALDAGFLMKINTVYIPGINEDEIPAIASRAGDAGAAIMNIIPLNPQSDFGYLQRPGHKMLSAMRAISGVSMPQMTHCRQCRADAIGALGEDRDMETEALLSILSEEFCDRVC